MARIKESLSRFLDRTRDNASLAAKAHKRVEVSTEG